MIILSILIICLLDNVWISWGKVICLSCKGVKGLRCLYFDIFVQQELELLPAKELQSNVYIRHSVSLEQVTVMWLYVLKHIPQLYLTTT